MGYGKTRLALPKVQCRHPAKSTGEQCKRWAVPGATLCPKHAGNREDIQDKATAMTTLATLLASDPRPWPEALQDHVHTLDAVAQDARVQAQTALDGGTELDPETYIRMVDTARLATSVINAAERTGILDRATEAYRRKVTIEAWGIARVLERTLSTLDLTYVQKRHVALTLRDSLNELSQLLSSSRRAASVLNGASTSRLDDIQLSAAPRFVEFPRIDAHWLRRQPLILAADPAPPPNLPRQSRSMWVGDRLVSRVVVPGPHWQSRPRPAPPRAPEPRHEPRHEPTDQAGHRAPRDFRPPGVGLLDTRTTTHYATGR